MICRTPKFPNYFIYQTSDKFYEPVDPSLICKYFKQFKKEGINSGTYFVLLQRRVRLTQCRVLQVSWSPGGGESTGWNWWRCWASDQILLSRLTRVKVESRGCRALQHSSRSTRSNKISSLITGPATIFLLPLALRHFYKITGRFSIVSVSFIKIIYFNLDTRELNWWKWHVQSILKGHFVIL